MATLKGLKPIPDEQIPVRNRRACERYDRRMQELLHRMRWWCVVLVLSTFTAGLASIGSAWTYVEGRILIGSTCAVIAAGTLMLLRLAWVRYAYDFASHRRRLRDPYRPSDDVRKAAETELAIEGEIARWNEARASISAMWQIEDGVPKKLLETECSRHLEARRALIARIDAFNASSPQDGDLPTDPA